MSNTQQLTRREEVIKTLEMLLGAEYIGPFGDLSGYFIRREKDGSPTYLTEKGEEIDNPWLTNLKKRPPVTT